VTSAQAGTRAGPVVIGYDGSSHATAALTYAAGLVPGAPALVVTVWKSVSDVIASSVLAQPAEIASPEEIDKRQRRAAEETARDGARLAAEAGLRAEPLTVHATDAIWEALAAVAHERDARLIVCGERRRKGAEPVGFSRVPLSLLLHGSGPLLVVPSVVPRR
jgi:nucleotide-binding universal stress UspA family protein